MRRILTILCFVFVSLCAMAQSDYISNSRAYNFDNLDELNGKRGIMLLSKSNNLVINVTNVPDAEITPKGQDANGFYEYEVLVGPDDTNPKLEVSIRGDVNITSFVAAPKKNFYVAYLIELVANPIQLGDQAIGGAILDAAKCEVDFTSNFSDLRVDVSPLLGATVTTTAVKGQKDVYETTVIIPIKVLQQAKQKMEETRNAYETHNRTLTDKSPDSEFTTDDILRGERDKAAEEYAAMSVLHISSDGTNTLSVSLDGLSPREKKSYAVLPVGGKVKKEYVTECNAHMAEAGRLFSLREYASAKKEYQNALDAKDTPKNLMNTIATQMAQCDSCETYQHLAIASLKKISDMKNSGTLTQRDLAKYAYGAAEFLKVVNKYNPSSYYTQRVATLEKMIEDMPIDFRILINRWVRDMAGFHMGGALPNVEAWGYYGSAPITGGEWSSDKRFKKLVESSADFRKLAVSGSDGIIQLELLRKDLPKAIFFRPNGYDGKIGIERKDMSELMQRSTGDYMMRQFNLLMYVKE